MTKKKKFKGTNAQLVGETRLTKREFKKLQAAYFNVERDNATKLADHAVGQIANGQVNLGGIANLGELNG